MRYPDDGDDFERELRELRNLRVCSALDSWQYLSMEAVNPEERTDLFVGFLRQQGDLGSDIVEEMHMSDNETDRLLAVEGLAQIVDTEPETVEVIWHCSKRDSSSSVRHAATAIRPVIRRALLSSAIRDRSIPSFGCSRPN